MPKIGLIGYGYWGSKVAQIILKNGFEIETIFTSKKINSDSVKCNHIFSMQNINQQSIESLTHIFILTGSPYHHNIVSTLCKLKSPKKLPYMWLEKPLYTDISSLNCSHPFEKKIYVDYPYSYKNANTTFVQNANFYSSDSLIEINLFSKFNNERNFGIVFDFMPHIVSLFSFFVSDLKALRYSNWRLYDTYSNESAFQCKCKVYSFDAISDADNIAFSIKFGINNTQASCLKLQKKNYDSPSKALPLSGQPSFCSINLCDSFILPVDQNIIRFLSSNLSDSFATFGPEFHRIVFDISCDAKIEFDKLAYK